MVPADKDIHDVWGYKYEFTDLHMTEEQQMPLRYSYDTVGEDVLLRVKTLQMKKAAENGEAAGKCTPRKVDLYKTLKSIALGKEDPVVTKFWEDVHTVPEWVNWDQIKRGQDVRHITNSDNHLLTCSRRCSIDTARLQ